MAADANKTPDRDDWLRDGYSLYMQSLTPQQKLLLMGEAWQQGFEAGGEEEAKRRMQEKYRELNPSASESDTDAGTTQL